jgi:hypothetical protein
MGGLRVNIIYGECHNFDGLDSGLAVAPRGTETAAVDAINIIDGDGVGLRATGWSVSSRANTTDFRSAGVNYAERMQGLQIVCCTTARTTCRACVGLIMSRGR